MLVNAHSHVRVQDDGLIHEPGRCVMKYQCGASSAPGGGLYDCVNNSLADPVDNTTAFFTLLQSTCPMLANVPDPHVCCDISMVTFIPGCYCLLSCDGSSPPWPIV